MVLLELCTEEMSSIKAAVERGIQRIELCDRLDVGGLTPSDIAVRTAVEYCHPRGVQVMVMIRPHARGFRYSAVDVLSMVDCIQKMKVLGIDGVVFGALAPNDCIDRRAIRQLLQAAGGLSVTFHMAFDAIPRDAQPDELRWLAAEGVKRVLVHGGPLCTPIEANFSHLRALSEVAAGAISIMPGGGVTYLNADRVVAELGVTELHGTRIVDCGIPPFGMER